MSEPTNSTTADLATIRRLLPLNRLQLIGVAGTPEARRALVRTPAGKILTVSVGDALDRNTVVAIDDDAIILSTPKGSETLRMPKMPDTRVAA